MMHKKLIMALGLAVFFMQACKDRVTGKDFSVTVTYENADRLIPMNNRKLVLEEIPFGGDAVPVILDSVLLKGNKGTVVLKGKAKEEGVYQLAVDNGPVLLVVNDQPGISVSLDMSKRDRYYTVSGSAASSQLQEFIQQYSDRSLEVNAAFAKLDSLKQFGAADSLVLAATNQKNERIGSMTTYLKDFIKAAGSPSVSLFALGLSSRVLSKEDFDLVLNSAVKQFPDHSTLLKLKKTYEEQQAQVAAMEKQRAAKSLVGKPAPALSMPDANGKAIAIADFKGKYLLVDFWASWCGPCRQENPNVVKAFEKFKDKNFTILGVSLDKDKSAWLKAIAADKLNWSQMSDLSFWDSEAVKVYGFEGIPYNVLIDPQGTIIAENLRGADLENKLLEVIK